MFIFNYRMMTKFELYYDVPHYNILLQVDIVFDMNFLHSSLKKCNNFKFSKKIWNLMICRKFVITSLKNKIK